MADGGRRGRAGARAADHRAPGLADPRRDPAHLAYACGVLCLFGVASARRTRQVSLAPEGGMVDEPLVDVIAHPEAEERPA
ncbi:MAG: hypothetical protein ACR2JU_04855 [Nocardioidaceae bacterium]